MEAPFTFTADTTLYAHWEGWFIENGETKTLVVAGKGDMEDFTSTIYGSYVDSAEVSSAGWGYEMGGILDQCIQVIEIKEGITRIGNVAFRGGSNFGSSQLTSVTIPVSVTSIGDGAFSFNPQLTTIDFGGTKAQWAALIANSPHTAIEAGVTVKCSDGELTTS